jgi:hypothetical protein
MAEKYTDQDCLNALRKAADELGHSPTRSEYEGLDIAPSASAIRSRFGGSWNEAKELAGLESWEKCPPKYDREDCLESLRSAAEQLGHSPSMNEYIGLGLSPSVSAIRKLVGKWNTAKEAAGIRSFSVRKDRMRDYTDAECIEALQEAARRVGRSPTRREYVELDLSPREGTITRRLGNGSWNAAKERAGLNPSSDYTEQDCIEAVRRAADELGHSPFKLEYADLEIEPSAGTIQQICGWNEAKDQAGLETWTSKTRRLSVNDDYFDTINTPPKAYWLGFLYADGSVQPNYNKVALNLQSSDRRHFDKFVSAVQSEYKVTEYVQQGNHKVRTHIISEKMVSDLVALGCVPNKAHKPNLPSLSDEMFSHFLRGYFDGDGSFQVDLKRNAPTRGRWSLTSSSTQRLRRIRSWLNSNGVPAGCLSDSDDWSSKLIFTAVESLKPIWDLLYTNGLYTSPSLVRKTLPFYQTVESHR